MMDMESFQIAIDNHLSCCMSNEVLDFVGPLTPTTIKIKGFQGLWTMAHDIGKLKWEIEDDHGKVHEFVIDMALYVTNTEQRLFYSQ